MSLLHRRIAIIRSNPGRSIAMRYPLWTCRGSKARDRMWKKLQRPDTIRKLANDHQEPHAQEQQERSRVDEKRGTLDVDVDQLVLHCRQGVLVIRWQNGSHNLAVP